MENQVRIVNAEETALQDGETIVGKVTKSFVQNGRVMGAVLGFKGRYETALLHRKRMLGDNRDARLTTSLTLGVEVPVKITIHGRRRKAWASEADVDASFIVDSLLSQRLKRIEGKVVNPTDYGVFVELQSGPAAGRRGLVHVRNMKVANKRIYPKQFKSGETIWVDVLGAKIDDKETLRIDLLLSASA